MPSGGGWAADWVVGRFSFCPRMGRGPGWDSGEARPENPAGRGSLAFRMSECVAPVLLVSGLILPGRPGYLARVSERQGGVHLGFGQDQAAADAVVLLARLSSSSSALAWCSRELLIMASGCRGVRC